MGRIGRRKTVLLSILITAFALFVPVVSYNMVTVLLVLSICMVYLLINSLANKKVNMMK